MAIQWYPGHMFKARREIALAMSAVDMVIEVLDSRLPAASSNPAVPELRRGKPCLRILNKSDLSDPAITRKWLRHLGAETNVKAIELSLKKPLAAKKIIALCRGLVPNRGSIDKPLRVMIMGIPNVGKSSLINFLLGKKLAHVADEPAVTKRELKVTLEKGFLLSDTPGILWPKIEDENSGFRLAMSGAIGRNAMDVEEVALFAAQFLLENYPALLRARYGEMPPDSHLFLEALGKKRNFLREGSGVDLRKTAEFFLKEYRSGQIGRISLESPPSENMP